MSEDIMAFERLRQLSEPDYLPALKMAFARRRPALGLGPNDPPPRILLLYGSLRERSYSRLVVEESARLLQFSDVKRGYSILLICRFPTRSKGTITRPLPNYGRIPCGRKGRSGAARNGMGRSPVS